ncbi:hypothetical protein CYMTET_3263 [Cymbomonas tetramitiformis]|uniref:Uncharacterized protein n=1 Tax=Cymbomonas tetramitiformis TaxID=36881 RepID=A0AAE0H3U1_9CHLO|nr:hypothetical protein CYMTET_3263 [Cymbomonas tetramitiformis]
MRESYKPAELEIALREDIGADIMTTMHGDDVAKVFELIRNYKSDKENYFDDLFTKFVEDIMGSDNECLKTIFNPEIEVKKSTEDYTDDAYPPDETDEFGQIFPSTHDYLIEVYRLNVRSINNTYV